MAISTFLELKASVIAWSHRNNLDLLIPDFIALCEADMFKNKPVDPSTGLSHESLQTRAMEQIATATMESAVALPQGFKQMRNLRYTDSTGGGEPARRPVDIREDRLERPGDTHRRNPSGADRQQAVLRGSPETGSTQDRGAQDEDGTVLRRRPRGGTLRAHVHR